MKRLPWILLLLVLTTSVVGYNLRFQETPLELRTVKVRRGPLEETVLASGRVEAVRESTIFAPRTGLVMELSVEEGSEILAGQLLARLRPILTVSAGGALVPGESGQDAVLAQAALGVEAARRHYEVAARQRERCERLFEKGLLAERAREEAELEHETARIRLEESEREYERVKVNVSPIEVIAPHAGRMLETKVEEGQYVSAGEPLALLASAGELNVVLQVPEADVAGVAPGQRVILEHPGWPSETFAARVEHIAPRAIHRPTIQGEETVVEVAARVLGPSPLKPGFNVDGELVIRSQPEALFVPFEALVEERDESWVAVIEDGHAFRRRVRAGIDLGTEVEIAAGLEGGERVALEPPRELADGSAVTARKGSERGG